MIAATSLIDEARDREPNQDRGGDHGARNQQGDGPVDALSRRRKTSPRRFAHGATLEFGSFISHPKVLVPFDPREAISLRQAAKRAGRSESTVRSWCSLYHIGRRVVGGPWQVSRVALAMLLDGNETALNAYLAGEREGPPVAPYFVSFGTEISLPGASE